MPKKAAELSARAVQELKCDVRNGKPIPTFHTVGGATGLYLQCTPPSQNTTGGRSWVYRYSFSGKRYKMGLGSFPDDLTLKQAHDEARKWAGVLAQQKDPMVERKKEESAAAAEKAEAITFIECAEEWIYQQTGSVWKNPRDAVRARQYMRDYAYPIFGNILILDIQRQHIKKMLNKDKIWYDKTPTATRLLRYVYLIINKGIANSDKQHSHFNVATYKTNLDADFPSPSVVHTPNKQAAIEWRELPGFMTKLAALDYPKGSRPDVQCFMFLMLCGTRSKATRHSDWSEIDLEKKIWNIPPHKVGKKTKLNWEIPLCDTAIKILKAQPSAKHKKGRVFSLLSGKKIPNNYLPALPKSLGYDATAHGFRRTIRNWAKHQERWDRDTLELLLQHCEESSTKARYDDEQMIHARRDMVNGYEKWAFSAINDKGNKVVPIRKGTS